LIKEAGAIEQEKDRVYFQIDTPVSIIRGNSSIVALPSDTLKISCTSADDRGVHTQHLSLEIDPEVYEKEICAARTFTVYEEIEELLKMGKIRGGSLENAVVLKGDKILSKEPLRFKDEFVRHKILDIVGDIFLLGLPLKAHIIAMRPGHAINSELTRALSDVLKARQAGVKPKPAPKLTTVKPTETTLDIGHILETIPHRYPFVMIDRIVEIVSEDELIALKNVTINEPFFQGHFPGKPVMPGVLQLEAMAQAAGILMLRRTGNSAKLAFFMSADKVKFRKPVEPGDQLVIYVKLLKLRGQKLATAEATCKVNDKPVSSAELMFTLVEPGDAS
jgi:UDP-3-O-[3-hydroxymyristoyl] N-acetylglucosamine deacetylase / 3-hydroxyacyl-[acyl-carrier-protein] dehydratase